MPKYQIVLTFETKEEVPQPVLEELEATCFVQLESLEDADLEGQEDSYEIVNSDSETKHL